MPSEIFWSLVVSTGSTVCLELARMCYKSKCKLIKCCGLEIDRDTDVEEREDHENRMQTANSPMQTQPQ